MRLSEKQIENFSLEQTMRAYSLCMADQDYGQDNRVQVHEHLCDLLGFDVTIFDEMDGLTVTLDSHTYERLLRQEIARLQKRTKTGQIG